MRVHPLAVVVCLLAGPASVAAQDRVRGGVLAGPSAASFTAKADVAGTVGGEIPDFTARAGFSAGLFIVSPVRHHVAFEPEALFTLKGANGEDAVTQVSIRITYVEIPLLVRMQSTGEKRASAHVVAGPVVGFRLGARQTAETFAGTTVTDVKDLSRDGAMSLAVGGGVDVGRFRLDARYNWGLSRLNTDTTAGLEIKSREFTVLAGFILW